VLFAKQLIHETDLKMSEVAFASGFGSVRRFNEIFRGLYGRPPSALRRKEHASAAGPSTGVTVRLRYRPPYDFDSLLGFLEERALGDMERVSAGRYARTFFEDGEVGTIEVGHVPEAAAVWVSVRGNVVRALPRIVNRVRRLFDLDADAGAIGAHLAQDPLLAPLVRARPGLRAPGAWDGFELGVRAVLGQQVSLETGRKLASSLVGTCGQRTLAGPGLSRLFPGAGALVQADLRSLRVPAARRRALVALAQAALEDPCLFDAASTIEATVARLRRIRGIGVWTAHYVSLRAAREPDAFPIGDAGLERGYALVTGRAPRRGELERRAERWRPFRAYAAEHLWALNALGDPNSKELRHVGSR
jgi:AraC family transcriptional regulator of adaptative response / DNA-3-methyladenine glycosylase II